MSAKKQRPLKISRQYQQKHLNITIPSARIPLNDTAEPYTLDELSTMKLALNTEKSKLDMYFELSKTDNIVKKQLIDFYGIIDIYKQLKQDIEYRYNAKPVTNAWLKYWEIYNQYNLIPQDASRLVAFFNAELPGAALCALNHYMKTRAPHIDFDWRASSLAPGETAKNDADALGDTYGLYAANKEKWLMSVQNETRDYYNNGDATIFSNIQDFEAKVGPGSPIDGVDLYSHDAGIDVSDDFNNQELSNAKLHLGCAIAGFMTLKVGGSFIAKQYTFFETFTWNLILIYAQMFDKFYICKPLTSRPYNSEIYLVGKGFKGFDPTIRDALISRLVNFTTSPFISDDAITIIGGEHTSALAKFSRVIFGQQAAIIKENIDFFDKYRIILNALRAGLDEFKKERARLWLACYPIIKILSRDNLASAVSVHSLYKE